MRTWLGMGSLSATAACWLVMACGGTSTGDGGGGSWGGAPASGGQVSTGGVFASGGVSTGGSSSGGAPAGGSASGGATTGTTGGDTGSGGADGTGGSVPVTPRQRVIGYLPNWYGSYATWATKVDFSKLTHVNLAFALGNDDGTLNLASNSQVDTFVTAAHAAGVKVFPSLCGGGGDGTIAPHYEPAKVDDFVQKIVDYAVGRHMDGIDVDVEAPGKMGAKYDTFIAKLLVKAHAQNLEVTAAVGQWMQKGMSDKTLLSFDFVNVMSYDATGTWTGPGAHSSYAQAVDDLDFYEGKGLPREKIVLGVPFYGYCWGSCGSGKSTAYVLYKDIVAKYPSAPGADWLDQGGAKYSYNGTATMAKKTQLAADYGGIMIWELGGDLATSNDNSLLLAIDNAQ